MFRLVIVALFSFWKCVEGAKIYQENDQLNETVCCKNSNSLRAFKNYSEVLFHYEDLIESYISSATSMAHISAALRVYPGILYADSTYLGMSPSYFLAAANNIVRSEAYGLDYDKQRAFITEVIFAIGNDFTQTRAQKLKASIRSTNSSGPRTAQKDVASCPKIFEHPLMRDAFAACAGVLTADEVAQILITQPELYFPLMVANYDAARKFVEWPTNLTAIFLKRIFDFVGINTNLIKSLTLFAENVRACSNTTLVTDGNYRSCDSLLLPVFKLPRFLSAASVTELKIILEAYHYDLYPVQAQTLILARGGLKRLHAELGDDPRAWTLLKSLVLLYQEISPDPHVDDTGDMVFENGHSRNLQAGTKQSGRTGGKRTKASKHKQSKTAGSTNDIPNGQHTRNLPFPNFECLDVCNMDYLLESELLVSAVNNARVNQLELFIVPCLQYLVFSDLIIRQMIFELAKPADEILNGQAGSVVELENQLEAGLIHRNQLIACMREKPYLKEMLTPSLLAPISTKIRKLLWKILDNNVDAEIYDLELAILSFVERKREVRQPLLAMYARPSSEVRSNGSIRSIVNAWTDIFNRTDLVYRQTMFICLFLFFDNIEYEGTNKTLKSVEGSNGIEQEGCTAVPDAEDDYEHAFEDLKPIVGDWESTIEYARASTDPQRELLFQFVIFDVLDCFYYQLEVRVLGLLCGTLDLIKIRSSMSRPVLEFTVVRSLVSGLALRLVHSEMRGVSLNICPSMLCNQLSALYLNLEHVSLVSILNSEQLEALKQSPSDDSVFSAGPQMWYSLSSVQGMALPDGVDIGSLQHSLHTVSHEDLIRYLDSSDWILNRPDIFLTQCSLELWTSAEFLMRGWELPAANLLAILDPKFADEFGLIQSLVFEPLMRTISISMESEHQIQDTLWILIKFAIMQDYMYRLLSVASSKGTKDQAHSSMWLSHSYMVATECQVRSRIITLLSDFDVSCRFPDSRQLKEDFSWFVHKGAWIRQASAERSLFIVEVLFEFLTHANADDEVLSTWADMYFERENALRLDKDDLKCLDVNDRVLNNERICELIQRYAPSATAAHVWSCRWKLCNLSRCLVCPITPETTIQTLGLKPQWLFDAEKDATLPEFELWVAKRSVGTFTRIAIDRIIKAKKGQF